MKVVESFFLQILAFKEIPHSPAISLNQKKKIFFSRKRYTKTLDNNDLR